MNPFGLLGEVESDDPSQIVAARPVKSPATVTTAKAVTQVKEAKNENARGGGRGGRGFGPGLDRGGFHRDSAGNENNGNGFFYRHRPAEDGESKKPLERRNYGSTQGSFRGGRRGGFNNGDAAEGEHSKRPYERCSGTGRGNEIKRDGAGQGNWGTASEDIAPVTEEPANENEKVLEAEKQVVDEVTGDSNKDSPVIETEEKPEDKMSLMFRF